jgi:hypothetical protein
VRAIPYSLPVSILVEIAEKADVPVEGVIRVLTREPVSDAVLQRVLAVLDDLTPEQARAVQRFALAALHDVLPRPLGADNEGMVEGEDVLVHEGQLKLPAASELETPAEHLPEPSPSDAALAQLSSVLSELAEAVRDLRRETDAERRERVDDLAVLIDLISTGWQGLDARLGRIEKQVARIDASRHPAAVPLPAPIPAPAAPPPIERAAEGAEAPPPAVETAGWRSRLPLAAALTAAGAVIGTFAVLQLTSTGPDIAAVVSARDDSAETSVGSSSTTGAPRTGTTSTPAAKTAPKKTTTARPPAAPPRTPTTSSVLGTTVGKTQPTRKPPARTTSTTPAAPAPPSFKPTRNWAWAPVADADYYSVEFLRGGKAFYKATPTEPQLTLPASVIFVPGAYRWVVRPGFGTKVANRLGPPVVNSGFTVT